jgi:predicted DsbA family dithiol-disulfide isomerase
MKYEPGKTMQQMLAEKKGISIQEATRLTDYVTNSANQLGLQYNLDKAIPANTFLAHQLSHFAATLNLQDEAEEALFQAYFIEGKNIGEISTLVEIGAAIGLPEKQTREVLETKAYSNEVNNDIDSANELGIRGVPFFVIDEKYAISGAQPSDLFKEALETAWKESSKKQYSHLDEAGTDTCSVNGTC